MSGKYIEIKGSLGSFPHCAALSSGEFWGEEMLRKETQNQKSLRS